MAALCGAPIDLWGVMLGVLWESTGHFRGKGGAGTKFAAKTNHFAKNLRKIM